jgi:hypothetical protein
MMYIAHYTAYHTVSSGKEPCIFSNIKKISGDFVVVVSDILCNMKPTKGFGTLTFVQKM